MNRTAMADAVELHIDSAGGIFGYMLNAEGDTLATLEFTECDCQEHKDGRCVLAKIQWEAGCPKSGPRAAPVAR